MIHMPYTKDARHAVYTSHRKSPMNATFSLSSFISIFEDKKEPWKVDFTCSLCTRLADTIQRNWAFDRVGAGVRLLITSSFDQTRIPSSLSTSWTTLSWTSARMCGPCSFFFSDISAAILMRKVFSGVNVKTYENLARIGKCLPALLLNSTSRKHSQ